MLIEPLLTENDQDKLSHVGLRDVILSHRLDMTGAFEDAAIEGYLNSHPASAIEHIPKKSSLNRQLGDKQSGAEMFSDVIEQRLSFTLRRVTEHHTVVEEIVQQLRDELEARSSGCLSLSMDMVLLAKSMQLNCKESVDYVLNVYGEVEIGLDCGRQIVLPCDRMLSSFPYQIESIQGRDDVSLLLTSQVWSKELD